jgi:hypothetical protein
VYMRVLAASAALCCMAVIGAAVVELVWASPKSQITTWG